MKEIKVLNPAPFCGKKHKELALVYGEDGGTRYNVATIDAPEGTEGSACVLVDYDPEKDYSELYRVTDVPTINPQF